MTDLEKQISEKWVWYIGTKQLTQPPRCSNFDNISLGKSVHSVVFLNKSNTSNSTHFHANFEAVMYISLLAKISIEVIDVTTR